MSSRDKILSTIKSNQPAFVDAPDISGLIVLPSDRSVNKFITSLQTIGGHSKAVNNFEEIKRSIAHQFPEAKRVVSTFNELKDIAEIYCNTDTIESAHDIDIAILSAHFGVAENGAVWLTEDIMCDRVLPFICQHLVVIIKAEDIVANMHEAYRLIGDRDYGFSIFIAGPSKTADIEQSLVLGAHGPISMTVFILQ
jgi:L-lactate dehydrogenase complex protein LldG